MAYDIIFQIYFKVFKDISEVNDFLKQFPNGELEPFEIDTVTYGDTKFKVYFKTRRAWLNTELNEMGLYPRV